MMLTRMALVFGAMMLLAVPVIAQSESLKGEEAPGFRLPTYSGEETVSLDDLRGKIVVLHFGTGW